MAKIAIIHYYPIDYFPPAMNLVNEWQKKATVAVFSTYKDEREGNYTPEKAQMHRLSRENRKAGSLVRMLNYLCFTARCLWRLITFKPDVILYYESVSALGAFLYKRFFSPRVRLCIHYHEYMTSDEYKRKGMRLSAINHWLERKYLYRKAYTISQTNASRRTLFLQDYPCILPSQCRVLPNYPPSTWHVISKVKGSGGVLRCAYVGSLSVKDMFVKEFCTWVASQEGRVTFDIYSFNYHDDVRQLLQTLQTDHVRFHGNRVEYAKIPTVLRTYDVGLILYKADTPNMEFNETNKLYEYLICGLDVWYSNTMTLIDKMDKSLFAPQILPFDAKKGIFPKYSVNHSEINNSSYNLFCENVYAAFLQEILK